MVPTSQLTPGEHERIAALLKNQPWFDSYYQSSLHDLSKGLDNRFYHLSPHHPGLIMGIHFDGVDICTTIGQLSDDDLAQLTTRPYQGEWHLLPEHMATASRLAGNRLRREDAIRFYRVSPIPPGATDPRGSRLTVSDRDEVTAFFSAHYPETVLSPWMLEQPFVGIRENGHLVATAGTLMVSADGRACHVGCFLTHPDWRGRGLAKVAARALFALLHEQGCKEALLGVFDANVAAWRAYEQLGFSQVEKRPLLYVERAQRSSNKGL